MYYYSTRQRQDFLPWPTRCHDYQSFENWDIPLLDPTLPIFQELNTTSLSTSKLCVNKNGWHPGKNPAAVLKNERNRMLFHLGAFFNFIFQAVNLYAPPQISGLGRGDSFRIQAHHLASGGRILQSPKHCQMLDMWRKASGWLFSQL